MNNHTAFTIVEVAPIVGQSLGYEYNEVEAEKSFAFIRHIKDLPEDAAGIY